MTKRMRVVAAIAVVVVLAAAAIAYASRPAQSADRPGPVARGTFHRMAWTASGRATLVRLQNGHLRLVFRNLHTKLAPDLYVYLFPNRNVGGYMEGGTKIAPLRSPVGDQNYAVPAGFDAGGDVTVAIWCEACDTENARAELHRI
jgi:hypothetical protein